MTLMLLLDTFLTKATILFSQNKETNEHAIFLSKNRKAKKVFEQITWKMLKVFQQLKVQIQLKEMK